jgi:hypothetical protein
VTVDNGRSCYLKEAAHPDGPFLVSAYEACHSPAVAASLQTRIRNWRSSSTFYRDARRFVPQNPRWLVTHCHSDPSWKVFGIGLILASVQGRYRHRSILRTVRKLGLFPNPLKQSVTALAAAVFLASDAANMLQPDDAGRQA